MDFGVKHVKYEDSAMGKLEQAYKKQSEQQIAELQQLRKDLDECRAEYAAYKAAEEHRTKIAERKAAIKSVIATFIVTVLAGIFLNYWNNIISFVSSLFYK